MYMLCDILSSFGISCTLNGVTMVKACLISGAAFRKPIYISTLSFTICPRFNRERDKERGGVAYVNRLVLLFNKSSLKKKQ